MYSTKQIRDLVLIAIFSLAAASRRTFWNERYFWRSLGSPQVLPPPKR